MKIATGRSSVLAAAAGCCALLLGTVALTDGAHAATSGTGYDDWASGGCKARAFAPVRIIRPNGVRGLLLGGVQYCPAGTTHTRQICIAVGNALGACNQVEKPGLTQTQAQDLLLGRPRPNRGADARRWPAAQSLTGSARSGHRFSTGGRRAVRARAALVPSRVLAAVSGEPRKRCQIARAEAGHERPTYRADPTARLTERVTPCPCGRAAGAMPRPRRVRLNAPATASAQHGCRRVGGRHPTLQQHRGPRGRTTEGGAS